METLKADLHTHTAEDPYDLIPWNAMQLIDEAARQGFRVLSISNHLSLYYSKQIADYAAERNILLVPGCEIQIGGRHVLLLNPTRRAVFCRNFDELRQERRKDHPMAVVAPHAFFPAGHSVRGWLYRYADVFDAVEWCSFYFRWANFNKFAQHASRILGLPMIGSSDTHYPWQFGMTYSLIEAEPTVEDVVGAIIGGRCRVVTKPFKLSGSTLLLALRGLGVVEKWPWQKGKKNIEM